MPHIRARARRPARHDLTASILLLCILLICLGAAPARPLTAHAAANAPAAVVYLSSATIAPGQTVLVTGYHFPSRSEIVLLLGTASTGGVITGYRILTRTRALANGSFRLSVTIPVDTPAGSYVIRAYGLMISVATGHITVIAAVRSLIVSAVKTAVAVSAASLTPGQSVTVRGSGFVPHEVVTITLSTPSGSAAIPLGEARADGAGAFAMTGLHIPFGIASGRQLVVATGQLSNRQASTAVTVVARAAALVVSPSAARPGEAIAIRGTHFQPSEVVVIDLVTLSGNIRLATAQASVGGDFSVSHLTLPSNIPAGTITVVATGNTSHLSATAQLTIAALPASITVSLVRTPAGDTVVIAGHGFIPGETLSVQIGIAGLKVTLATVVANSQGAFRLPTVVVPPFLPANTYTITVSGQSSGRTASAPIVVSVHRAAAPSLSITGAVPVSGAYQTNPGGLLQIAGSGFPAGATVTFALIGPRTITLTSGAATGSGIVGPLGATVPATTPAGVYALHASVSGRTLASTQVRVAALAPRLRLSTGNLSPGATVRVTGSGYAANEQVVVALNGAALVTTPGTIITNAAGQFAASFVVPSTVSSGANVLIATGATSRVSASATASATLPVASSWYFVNGDTSNGRTTTISILNANNAITTVKMTFLYQAGSEQHYTQAVPAHTLSLVDLGLVAGTGRIVSTILEADHVVSAESTVNYPGGDSTATNGATGPATRWYLAEGYTNGSFSETIHVMNPNNSYATVDVQFLPFNNKPARETRFVMLPGSTIQINAGDYMPGLSISAIVSADKPIVVERSMHFGLNGRGAHDKIGVTTLSTVWIFAQGESGSDRQTFFTILNPNQAASAAVTATFFNSMGQPVGARTIVVDPLHRGNIKLNDVLPNAEVATVLTSNVPVAVERPLYIGPAQLSQAPAGSVIFGRNGGSLSWSFPGGSTLSGDQTTMYLFNPGLQAVQVKATFFADSGAVTSETLVLAPNSATTLNAASVPNMQVARFGAVLQSTNGQPFIAEESVQNSAAQTYDSIQGVAQ